MHKSEMSNVTYLLGAGATHACIKAEGMSHGLLMKDLQDEIMDRVRSYVASAHANDLEIVRVVNRIQSDMLDVEQVITFFGDSVLTKHGQLASKIKTIFMEVLKNKLELILSEKGALPNLLLHRLMQYHSADNRERIRGMLTLNYDDYLEAAIRSSNLEVEYGIQLDAKDPTKDQASALDKTINAERGTTLVLKLHGSLNWQDTWPLSIGKSDSPTWIPPGIQKSKNRYPFSVLWGIARELMNCDTLRIVGCRLSPNDWDLISMIFSAGLLNEKNDKYVIEVIDSPLHAEDLKKSYPYLKIRGLFELRDVGNNIKMSLTSLDDSWEDIEEQERTEILQKLSKESNWFNIWLNHKVEELWKFDMAAVNSNPELSSMMEGI